MKNKMLWKRDPHKINEIIDFGFCGTNPTAPIFRPQAMGNRRQGDNLISANWEVKSGNVEIR
ncbi:hypothetical protein AMJ83_04830 [candidate division WOR_3 bacterium SM23_42]|uniref:Uncharacterized protein n=1 Tax=candidate division WOR_3 bacterium SM23_42 TaxID=1703779 RepID=A0A0S8FST9_UNCW3|nr:MAG: hypothetical protein AMJ83_04830 [candidate division WOR_3 bacterium SM23_42]